MPLYFFYTKVQKPKMTKISNQGVPLSATWRIYPSSKWSSQWPYDGYIRHGWMTSCGRGRDSATLECFGRGYRGTIFVRSSKLSLFFQSYVRFEEFFCFPRFWKIWRQMFKLWGFWFGRCFWALFENSAPSQRRYRFALFAVFVDVDVQLQDGQAAARGQRRKAVIRDISGVDHWGVTNLSAPIWYTGQKHCTVFRHVMQLSLLVLY